MQKIEKHVVQLSQLKHKNLVSYECVLYMKKKEGVILYLAQDFVSGACLNGITDTLGWSNSGISIIAKAALDALIFLHNKGVSHSMLDSGSIFMDNSGVCRITDFKLIPYLCDLIGFERNHLGDLPALGYLIESLVQTPNTDVYDFIEKCKSERTLSASDLLEHPFLMPMDRSPTKLHPMVLPIDKKVDEMPMPTLISSGRSRLQVEFEVLQWLGQGAYGDVLKVKNILDNRQYAIKRIPLTCRSRQIFKKMTREVELLSRLNHENVVRYYNSWIENANEKDLDNTCFPEGDDFSRSAENELPVRMLSNQEASLSSDWMGIS